MKTNLLFMRFSFCAILFLSTLPTMATKLKIVNMAPNQKIHIGAKDCGIGSIFDAYDTIYWNRDLENQAFEVICVRDCKDIKWEEMEISRNCSLLENERKGGMNMNFATLVGMFSKGDANDEPIILWPRELILVEGVNAQLGFEYYCRVKDNMRKLPVVVRENEIYLQSDDFKDFGTEITIQIYQANLSDALDIQIIKEITVEQVK